MSSNIKFDKETLVKHRFWIGLGLFVPLWLVAWLVLWLTVSDEVTKTKEAYAKSLKDIETVKDPKTTFYTTPMTEKKGKLTGRKETLWVEVWNTQSNIPIEWPTNDKAPQLAKLASAPFMSPINDDAALGITGTSARQEFRDVIYEEYRNAKRDEFTRLAGPISMDFESVIEMPPIAENRQHLPTDEEIWLTQENVWVKRELLRIIRNTIDTIAYFHPVEPSGKEEPLPEKTVARRRYRNSNWELELLLKRGDNNRLLISKTSTLKNVNRAKRTMLLRDVQIWVTQTSATDPNKLVPGPVIKIQGEPVPWNQKVPIGAEDVRVDNYTFSEKQPIWATQYFTWSTTPIKQIDTMLLGYQSSRTAFQELRSYKGEDTTADAAAAAPAAAPASTAAATATNTGAAAAAGAPAPAPGAAPAAGGKNQSPLGIDPKRYIQVTGQVRRIPVGLVLVIDQEYIEDLMAQFVNSRLRFQPTQVQWQQDTRGLRPPEEAPKDGERRPNIAGMPRPGGPGGLIPPPPGVGMPEGPMMGGAGPGPGVGMMMGMQNRMASMMMGGGMQPIGMMPGGIPGVSPVPGQSTPGTGEETDPNLVEFALYGIISLYDRFIPQAASDSQPGAAPQPGAQQPPANQPAAPVAPGAEPTPGQQPKPDAAPKADEKKDAAPKADEKKNESKPAGGEAPKAGENKGS
jgi:hypothetical protein